MHTRTHKNTHTHTHPHDYRNAQVHLSVYSSFFPSVYLSVCLYTHIHTPMPMKAMLPKGRECRASLRHGLGQRPLPRKPCGKRLRDRYIIVVIIVIVIVIIIIIIIIITSSSSSCHHRHHHHAQHTHMPGVRSIAALVDVTFSASIVANPPYKAL